MKVEYDASTDSMYISLIYPTHHRRSEKYSL